jgi:diguanylate cyclase (GGDEF)-like protein
MLIKAIATLEKLGKPFWIVVGFASLFGVGILDYVTGYELAFSLFYLVPIALLTWFANRQVGIIAALLSAGVWLTADIMAGVTYSHPAIYFWNTLIRLGFFILAVFFLELAKALEYEKTFARTDYVTGAVNSRFFHILTRAEIDLSVRYSHPFTIAYIDIDNFKTINDRFGHTIGDSVLRAVANSMQQNLRKTDIVARMGGDEFAILLPDTGSQAAQAVISKMRDRLAKEMRENNWLVTFSIGVLTFNDAPPSVDEAIKMADLAMYTVKNGSKNNISYTIEG